MGLTETILQIRKVVHKQRIHEFGGVNSKHLKKMHPVESNCMKIRRKGVDDHIYNRKHLQTFFWVVILESHSMSQTAVWHWGSTDRKTCLAWPENPEVSGSDMPPATGAEDTLAQLSMLVQDKGIPPKRHIYRQWNCGAPNLIAFMHYPNLAMYWWLASLKGYCNESISMILTGDGWQASLHLSSLHGVASSGFVCISSISYISLICPGWWYTYPSETYESQLGWLFPIDRKIKVMFHTTNQMLIDLMSMWDHYECATSQCDIPSCNQQSMLLPWLPADSFWVTLSSAHWCFGAWEITYLEVSSCEHLRTKWWKMSLPCLIIWLP